MISMYQVLKLSSVSVEVKTFFVLFHMEGPEHIPLENYEDD